MTAWSQRRKAHHPGVLADDEVEPDRWRGGLIGACEPWLQARGSETQCTGLASSCRGVQNPLQ